MRKRTLLILSITALGLAAIAASPSPQAGSAAKTNSATAKTTAGSTGSLLNPSSLKLQAPAVFDAKIVTTKGDFVIEVTRSWAPHGADRFYNLVKYHFFDNAAFFRVVPGFVVQFGISARPDVTRAWRNTNITDDPVMQSNARGTVTFATAGPNTRTTQIFINLGENSRLDNEGFSPFGKVISGMQVVDALYSDYGDGPPGGHGPDQDLIQSQGKPYLDRVFPQLDSIKATVVVPPAPAAPAKPPVASK
jgi:peptidyl-prolyl cis-trans isomerase A (cyclophilin A)